MKKLFSFFLLVLIVGVGTGLRLANIIWDQGFHLHPDERFLVMIGLKEILPSNFFAYLSPVSSMNPYTLGFSFFVYGIFPLTLNFLLSLLLHTKTYDLFTIQGRMLSALFDTGSIVVVFLLSKRLAKEISLPSKTPFIAAFFYALSVLPIQLSHFFAVDIFLSFFVVLSLYFAILYKQTTYSMFAILAGIAVGLAVACKITALAILPLDMFLIFLPFVQRKQRLLSGIQNGIFFVLFSYLAIRIADPYLFASGNIFDIRINQNFISSIKSLLYFDNPSVWYPPNVQWVGKLPIVFALFNIVVFGIGIGISVFLFYGIVYCLRKKNILLLSLLSWTILFFLYQSVAYVKTMRYFIMLYPLFALFAGIGFAEYLQKKSIPIILFAVVIILLWPVSFLSIYTRAHTRVTATQWINTHLPDNSIILGEYWDDPLPLDNPPGKHFTIDLLHVFDPDTTEKWQTLQSQLDKGDYLVLSSNRGWGSIMQDKKTYPLMSKWYADLFANKLPYRKIATFTSYPSLTYLGIPLTLPDTFSEEAFTVYDHPVVMIFKHIR